VSDNQLQVILAEQNVPKENAQLLLTAFGAPFEEAGKILAEYQTIVVTEEDQFDLMAEARNKRLSLKNIRVDVEKKRKELKEDSLRTGRAIDSVAKFVKEIIEPAEKYLETQEKFAEIRQAERAAKVKAERIEKLMQYTSDLSLYNMDAITDEQFNTLLESLEYQHEIELAEQKRIEDEYIAKEKAEAEEQERVRAENAKLKKEAEEREKKAAQEKAAADKLLAEERAKAEAAQKAKDEELRVEREKAAQIERERAAEREAAERERAQREAEEARAKAAEEEKQRQALLAPDKEKLLALAVLIDQIELPALSSKSAQEVLNRTEEFLGKVSTYIRGNVKGL
jgi:hypothetical protein